MSELPVNYYQTIIGLRERIRLARLRASAWANAELLHVHWEIGKAIIDQQKEEGWGTKVIDRFSADLKAEFPDFKGLSVRNLKYMRAFAESWPEFGIVQPSAAQIDGASKLADSEDGTIVQQLAAQILWGHHQVLLDKVKDRSKRLYYMQKTLENGWGRDILVHQIESGHFERSGRAITNFKITLPAGQSDLAQQSLKNPYVFDFLEWTDDMRERDLEKALIQHLKNFMLELGRGFAWVGNQKNLVVQGDDFFLDLLFYNYHMHCFIVFELKIGEFKPEFAGKLNFYVNTIDAQLKGADDNPTIGVLLCKTPNETVIKYSLKSIESPIGVTSYQFEKALPAELKGELPTVEELEQEIEQSYEELKNPADKKVDRLKSLLKNLKEPEVKDKKSKAHTKVIFERVVAVLLSKMVNRFEKELAMMFQENEVTVYIEGSGFPDYDKAEAHLREHDKYETNGFKIEFRSNGFKKAGKNAFNCWSGLWINLQKYKYSFSLVTEQRKILMEKLYHEMLASSEEDMIVEVWFEELVDDISKKVEDINKT